MTADPVSGARREAETVGTTVAQTRTFILFSGTADKLHAAATMIAGLAASGVTVQVFLTYWGLWSFRRDQIEVPKPMSAEYRELGEKVAAAAAERGFPPWYQLLRDAKDLGDVHFHACSMSMDLLGLDPDDLDPLVDDVVGTAAFTSLQTGDAVFI